MAVSGGTDREGEAETVGVKGEVPRTPGKWRTAEEGGRG